MPGFEYFCGANVVVVIEGQPLLEAAGLSVDIHESKMPIYGYSSRHFDAVASGQVLVEGSLIINYVDQDYLAGSIEMGLNRQGLARSGSGDEFGAGSPFGTQTTSGTAGSSELFDLIDDAESRAEMVAQYILDPVGNAAIGEALKSKLLVDTGGLVSDFATGGSSFFNPHDSYGGMDIQVMFGNRSVGNNWLGDHGFLLKDVYFIGRGIPIRIDEEVIVEEHRFFARNIIGIETQYRADAVFNDITDEWNITVGNQTSSLSRE
jgi:hypothetical protein